MKMAMYRWQVTHASPQPYFASRFHCHDNNNDDNNNNNKIAEAEKEKMEYYSTFIHKNKDGKIYLQHIDDIGIFDGFKFVECFFFFLFLFLICLLIFKISVAISAGEYLRILCEA
jgi:hypothetical protein